MKKKTEKRGFLELENNDLLKWLYLVNARKKEIASILVDPF